MESSVVMSVLDRIHRVSRNAEKTLALECKNLQLRLEGLPEDPEEKIRALHSIADSADNMNQKIAECSSAKNKLYTACKKRLLFFKDECQSDPERLLDWLLCEYLSRRGFLQSAKMLASVSELADLIDINIYEQHRQIVLALSNHNTDPALRWCQANKSRLQAAQSPLEFNLRLRDFVGFVVKRDFSGAIHYVKRHMLSEFENHNAVLKRHFGLVAFFDQAMLAGEQHLYSDLLDDSCWKTVQSMFSQEFFQVHKLSPDPQLDFYLKTGLCALKTQSCGTPTRSISDCPVCSQDVVELAAKLKAAPKTMSCLVCRLTGEVMDESNPPIAVPNGQVYSKAGLYSLALMHGGDIRCPETGASYCLSDCKNVFVL